MLTNLDQLIQSALQSAGFSPYTDFSQINAIEVKSERPAFLSIKNLGYSSKFYCCYSERYAVEVSGSVNVKAFSMLDGNRYFSGFNKMCFHFIENIFCSEDIVISSVDRNEIKYDASTRRLRCDMTINFKFLITNDVEEE